MSALKYQIAILIISLFAHGCKSQTNSLYFEGEKIESIKEKGNWFLINSQGEIKGCNPKIEFIKGEENGFEGSILIANEESILIFKTKKKLNTDNTTNKDSSKEEIKVGSQIQITKNQILFAKSITINDDEILSLEIEDKEKNQKYEIFRNCRVLKNTNSYFGCGRLPFKIDFIGDIINDKKPEIILSAEKEGGVLKLVIGFKEDKYQILKWTEFE